MTKDEFINSGIEEGDIINFKDPKFKYSYIILEIDIDKGFLKLENNNDNFTFWIPLQDIEIEKHTPYKNLNNTNFTEYTRPCAFSEVKQWCHLSKDNDFIEVCRWKNSEGFDITINDETFAITDGQLELINVLYKKIENKF